MLSIFTGTYLNKILKDTFANIHIEDLLIPYACTAVDILACEECIDRSGILWRAVRGSMSLVGFVPPFPGEVDQHGNVTSLLVDGAYALNFPVKTVEEMGAGTIITMDVAAYYTLKHHHH